MKAVLNVREAGFLLQEPEHRVRHFLAIGRLTACPPRASVDPDSLRQLFPPDHSLPLRKMLMSAILDGRLVVPAPEKRYGRPLSLLSLAKRLYA